VISASVPPPSNHIAENSAALRFGALVGLAAATALVCTLPAMVRVSAALAGSAPAVRAWGALGAAALGPMGLALVVLRRARRELHALGEPVTRLRLFGIGLWLALLFITLALLGGVLRATTHHHALAGVTYGCGALALAAGWGLVCARLVAMLRGVTPEARRLAIVLLGAGVLATIGYLGLRFLIAVSSDSSSSAAVATVVDVLAFSLTALLASLEWRLALKPLAIVGPPVAVFLGALGITTLRDPPVREAIGEHAPAFVPVTDLISFR
jgi:hypothetical protein